MAPKLYVLIVTYGRRHVFLEQVIASISHLEQVSGFVVILNGKTDCDAAVIKKHAKCLACISCAENIGSAGGVAEGLQYLFDHCGSAGYVLLLDDDNVVTSLDTGRLNNWLSDYPQACLSLIRSDRHWQIEVLQDGGDASLAQKRQACLGFDFVTYLKRKRSKRKQVPQDKSLMGFSPIDWAPWGGLLMPLRAVSRVGLPDAGWFAYFDDCEYTFKLSTNGFPIWVTDVGLLKDIDASWCNAGFGETRWLDRLLLNGDDWRVNLAIRNQAYFEHQIVSRQGRYPINLIVLVIALFLRGVALGRVSRALNLFKWIMQGRRGSRGLQASP